MLGRLVNDKLREEEYNVWVNTLSIIQSANWRMANLECVISDKGNPWKPDTKPFHFRTDPKNLSLLQTANIDVLSCANNLIFDETDSGAPMLKKILFS